MSFAQQHISLCPTFLGTIFVPLTSVHVKHSTKTVLTWSNFLGLFFMTRTKRVFKSFVQNVD